MGPWFALASPAVPPNFIRRLSSEVLVLGFWVPLTYFFMCCLISLAASAIPQTPPPPTPSSSFLGPMRLCPGWGSATFSPPPPRGHAPREASGEQGPGAGPLLHVGQSRLSQVRCVPSHPCLSLLQGAFAWCGGSKRGGGVGTEPGSSELWGVGGWGKAWGS